MPDDGMFATLKTEDIAAAAAVPSAALVAFERREHPRTGDRAAVFSVIDAAFAQRRKTLRAALAEWAGSPPYAETVLLRIGLDALALQRAPKTGTRDAIEGEIEHQQMVLQQDFGQRAEMAPGISFADAEVCLGLHSERVGEKIVGAEQHIFFEAFDVDLEEVDLGNQPFSKKSVQTADRHRAGLLARRHFETTGPLRVHRAGGRICRIEMEHPFLVGIARGDAMVVPVRHIAGAFAQLLYGFLDGIESMNDQVIGEPVPGSTLAALNADVDEHEGLTQKARLHHPVGERGVGIGKQIQPLLRLTLRGAVPRLCSEQDTIRMIKKRRRVSVVFQWESEAAARAPPDRSWNVPCGRVGPGRF